MDLYFEVLPLKHLWLGGSSGSSGSGASGTTTTNNTTKNEMLPWSGYVPPETYAAYQKLMPQLEAKSGIGLTPQEKSYYTGQGMAKVAQGQSGARKSLAGNLARSGARGPATTEAYGDLARSGVMANAGVVSNVQGMDISSKQQNMANLMKGISIPGSPINVGGTTTGTTNYAPQSSGGGGS